MNWSVFPLEIEEDPKEGGLKPGDAERRPAAAGRRIRDAGETQRRERLYRRRLIAAGRQHAVESAPYLIHQVRRDHEIVRHRKARVDLGGNGPTREDAAGGRVEHIALLIAKAKERRLAVADVLIQPHVAPDCC